MTNDAGLEKQLWADYFAGRVDGNGVGPRRDLIEYYLPWAKAVINSIEFNPDALLERGDLLDAGIVGLFGAIKRYDSGLDVEFKSYAEPRLRGAVCDVFRQVDPVSRWVRTSMNQVNCAWNVLFNRLGCEPDSKQLLKELADDKYVRPGSFAVAPGEKARRIYSDAFVFSEHCDLSDCTEGLDGKSFLGFSEGTGHSGNRFLFDAERRNSGIFALSVPLKERTVLGLYYGYDLEMREVGERIGYTESRVSQLHNKVLNRLRCKTKHMDSDKGENFVLGFLDFAANEIREGCGFSRG